MKGEEKSKRKGKLFSTCCRNPFKLHFLYRNFYMSSYHLYAFYFWLFSFPLTFIRYTYYIYPETKLAIHTGDMWPCIYFPKKFSNLNIAVAGGGCQARPDCGHTTALPGTFLASPFTLTQAWQRKARNGKKGWLNLKIIQQGCKKLPLWSTSKSVKSSLIIKVRMAWFKTQLMRGLGLLPRPDLDSVPPWSLSFVITPDLTCCTK